MKKIATLILSVTGIVSFTSCNKRDFKIVKDYLIEMPTYETVDYDYASKWFKVNPFSMGGCSAVVKDVGDEGINHLIVGRNMDYGFSKKCAYIIRTDEPGGYKTLGLSFASCKASPDFKKVKANGISDEWRKMAPFFCTDIINEHGLYCEIDMRNVERDDQGKSKFHCSGTNPFTGVDVHMVAVTRFVVNHCRNVSEAIDYVRHNINVFNNENDWNFSFLLADTEGNYGVLEFAHNDIYWNPKEKCHSNYFISSDLEDEVKNKFGFGRREYLIKDENYNKVYNAPSMFNLIDVVRYSNVYKGRECPFDMRGETFGTIDMPFEQILDDTYKEEVYKKINEFKAMIDPMPEEERRQHPWYWQSTFTNVVDVPNKTIYTRMFEDSNYTFIFKL